MDIPIDQDICVENENYSEPEQGQRPSRRDSNNFNLPKTSHQNGIWTI